MLTLIQMANLNEIDPQAWLAEEVLARIDEHSIHSLDQPWPWNWKAQPARLAA
jgi:transposase